ncbi:galectin-8-like [Vombatus ursinus]|uniref:Galectin n=1 Tax=Vombatus ursinus TaxID=29139 RepID=A0A4X2LY75_VOMUR|nr:galectin-8-like [Vombatus ursinus]
MTEERTRSTTVWKDNMMPSSNPQNVIHNPVIPYVGTHSEELQPGKMVVIHGHVPDDADRFQVDFQCGSSVKPRADVAFHFNPKFTRLGYIVCNTLMKEKWRWEEITYEMPFEKGKPFEIMIMVLKDKFQVAVNGKRLLSYRHRIEPEKIDTLGIYGKVQIVSIEFYSNCDCTRSPSNFSGNAEDEFRKKTGKKSSWWSKFFGSLSK